jgi:hypothetical protein
MFCILRYVIHVFKLLIVLVQVHFLVTLLSIPESCFNVAFKMLDLDHNGCVVQLLVLISVCKLVRLLSCLEVLLSHIDGCMYMRSFIAGDI